MDKKIEKIKRVIEETTGKSPDLTTKKKPSKGLEASLISDVLLFSTSYNYFLIQEEGRLDSLIEEKFSYGGIRQPPNIQHVESEDQCKETIQHQELDLLIIFGRPLESEFEKFLDWVRKKDNELPVVWITNNDINSTLASDEGIEFEEVFTWNGDGKIILTIVQYIEDKIRFMKDGFDDDGLPILLIEDSKQYYSTYLTNIYEKIWSHLDAILHEDLTREKKIQRYLRRSYVILAEDIEEGKELYSKVDDNLL